MSGVPLTSSTIVFRCKNIAIMTVQLLPTVLYLSSLVGMFVVITAYIQLARCSRVEYQRLNTNGIDISTSSAAVIDSHGAPSQLLSSVIKKLAVWRHVEPDIIRHVSVLFSRVSSEMA